MRHGSIDITCRVTQIGPEAFAARPECQESQHDSTPRLTDGLAAFARSRHGVDTEQEAATLLDQVVKCTTYGALTFS